MSQGNFSKTFVSATYQQIVVMKDTEQGYNTGMAPLPVLNIFFMHDGATHMITLSFGNDEIGQSIRNQAFEEFDIIELEQFITERLEQGVQ